MLTEAQFREIANSIQNIVVELKKMNEQPMYQLFNGDVYTGSFEDQNMYREADYRGPTIA